jgi:hypothetical protein
MMIEWDLSPMRAPILRCVQIYTPNFVERWSRLATSPNKNCCNAVVNSHDHTDN